MMKETARRSKPEGRPDVAGIRKIYDIVLCVILAIQFIAGPIYLFFTIYPVRFP